MYKRITLAIAIAFLSAPLIASAATTLPTDNQLVALYTQIINLLEQEIPLLQNPTQTYLSIYPTSGPAPLFVTFLVNNPTGYESIGYGDGHTTGSDGCVKNVQGWCDLTKPVAHQYLIPGIYTVLLYRHTSSTTVEYLSTSTVDAMLPSASQYDPSL